MSVQLAPPLVVMSRNPPAAPTAMWRRSMGLTPRLYGLERKRRAGGRAGGGTPTGEAWGRRRAGERPPASGADEPPLHPAVVAAPDAGVGEVEEDAAGRVELA